MCIVWYDKGLTPRRRLTRIQSHKSEIFTRAASRTTIIIPWQDIEIAGSGRVGKGEVKFSLGIRLILGFYYQALGFAVVFRCAYHASIIYQWIGSLGFGTVLQVIEDNLCGPGNLLSGGSSERHESHDQGSEVEYHANDHDDVEPALVLERQDYKWYSKKHTLLK